MCSELVDKLYELLEFQEFFDAQRELMDAFAAAHQFRWQVGMNGRSGGYLVLYEGGINPLGTVPIADPAIKETSRVSLRVATSVEDAENQTESIMSSSPCRPLPILEKASTWTKTSRIGPCLS